MTGAELQMMYNNSGMTGEKFAGLLGISRASLYIMFKELKITSEIESIINKEKEFQKIKQLSIKGNDAKQVPYYDLDATAGNVTIFSEDKVEYITQYLSVPAFSDCDMFINVSGNSMYPRYCSGELIALKKVLDYDIVPYNEAYLVVTKEQRLLKFIRKGSDKLHWKLCSQNDEFEPFEVPIKKVLHLYIVKGKITKNII